MAQAFFVTGTDTGVGKTTVSAALLYLARQQGLTTAAAKPVASGCEQTAQGLRNSDALALCQQCTVPLTYDELNPYAFAPPIAPHLAADEAGIELSVSALAQSAQVILDKGADLTLVEGAGGWRVPINRQQTLADVAHILQLPVILVVGVRLGCINHALLTAEAIQHDGLILAGWVANGLEPETLKLDENFNYFAQHLAAPCLGHIPYLQTVSSSIVARYLSLSATTQRA